MDKTRIVTGQSNNVKQEIARLLRQEQTSAEQLLWERLRRGQLNSLHFRRQQVIDGFIVDFYCHRAGLIVEVDGAVHEQNPEKDRERDAIFQSLGLTLLHFTNLRIETEMFAVLTEIADKAALRTSAQRDGEAEQSPPSQRSVLGKGAGG